MDRRRSLLKIAALRSERERQAGVNIGDRQSVSLSSITAFIGAPVPIGTSDFTFEYFGNAYWATSGNSPLIFNNNSRYPYGKGSLLIYGDSKVAVQWVLFEMPSSGTPTDDSILLSAGDKETPFHFVVTRKGTTVKAYFNGELKATKEQSAVKDLGDFRLGMSNGSNMVMSRIYNYALSAEEAAALYNDGDPAGYVLPSTMKGLTPVEITGENSHTWTGVDSPYSHSVALSRKLSTDSFYRVKITVSDYESGIPDFKISSIGTTKIPAANGTYTFDVQVKGTPYPYILLYAGPNGTDRRVTITVDSIESVGCVAEYLPQNLVGSPHGDPVEIIGENSHTWTGVDDPAYSYAVRCSRYFKISEVYKMRVTISDYEAGGAPFFKISTADTVILSGFNGDGTYELYLQVKGTPYQSVFVYAGPTATDRRMTITVDSIEAVTDVALSWLNSARKLPLNDEYLPPLLQSDGGYDLTASGTPEIIIK